MLWGLGMLGLLGFRVQGSRAFGCGELGVQGSGIRVLGFGDLDFRVEGSFGLPYGLQKGLRYERRKGANYNDNMSCNKAKNGLGLRVNIKDQQELKEPRCWLR